MAAGSFRGKLVRDWLAPLSVTHLAMTTSYARCSTDKQDLAAARIYTDHGLTGTNRSRPGARRQARAGIKHL